MVFHTDRLCFQLSHNATKLQHRRQQRAAVTDGAESAGQQQDGPADPADVSVTDGLAENRCVNLL